MNSKRGTLIVIAGPTGSGKTTLSIELAKCFDAPIISTDSRQVFRGMAIGTAQPTAEQLAEVCHYFIADRDISDEYNAGVFEKEALCLLRTLFETNDYVVAVGGSGLYIDALCDGLDDLPDAAPHIRKELEHILDADGVEVLLDELKERDPEYYEQVDRDNPARVLRAVEVCRSTGKPYSSLRSGIARSRDFNIIKIGVDIPREELYRRINARVDEMLDLGLEHEARLLYDDRDLNALNTVGYKEMFSYFDGDISKEEAAELIKRNSRRYAKRQITWFRRDGRIEWFSPGNIEIIEKFIKKFAE